MENYHEKGDLLAEHHVEWLMNLMVPIIKMIAKEEFVHGYKHGLESKENRSDIVESFKDLEEAVGDDFGKNHS